MTQSGTVEHLADSPTTHLGVASDRRLQEEGIQLIGTVPSLAEPVVNPAALVFVGALCHRFEARRQELLARRGIVQREIDAGKLPGFLPDTDPIRRETWTVTAPPSELRDRRIEITGPTDRRMVINALNSGAQVYMADFEDSHAPAWKRTLEGQRNLYDAARGDMEYESPEGKTYRLKHPHAVLMMRPRGWHLDETGLRVQGAPASASLFDAGLYLHANAARLRDAGSGVYLYLPKLQSWEEAALWEDVFTFAETSLGLSLGTIRCTVLIETLPALFQMHEILHALQGRILGLNLGRWDYLFSFIKTFRAHPEFLLPDRSVLTMDTPFMLAASRYLVRTCHERGAQAIGGMAADIPVRDDEGLNSEAIGRVRTDKQRELDHGYDGTWVAHPGLVPIVQAVFVAPRPLRAPAPPGPDPAIPPFLDIPRGGVSEAGVRANVNAALQYLESWLRGFGAVALHHRMEDTATAEISRAQLWQWLHLEVSLASGVKLTPSYFRQLLRLEDQAVRREVGEERWSHGEFARARALLDDMVSARQLDEFLTLRAGPWLDKSPLGLTP